MFHNAHITDLIALLQRRGVSLFHACQYTDFCAYLALGGIPSRAVLATSGRPFTPFETDVHDRQNGVWDKVFVNLADFGELFARGKRAVPNPYGPIVIQIRPEALLDAADVAVCYRSAGAADFDRDREAMRHVAEVDALFMHPPESEFPWGSYLKPPAQLQTLRPGARLPEVSCTVAGGRLALGHVIVVWTDPYAPGGRPLRDWVGEAVARAGAGFPVWERSCHAARPLYGELLARVMAGGAALRPIAADATASPALRAWAGDVLGLGLDYQFHRYACYLLAGTAGPLAAARRVALS